MSTSQAQFDAAQALYKAITEQVEKIERGGTSAFEALEKLAHAYSLVSQTDARDPSEKGKGRGGAVFA